VGHLPKNGDSKGRKGRFHARLGKRWLPEAEKKRSREANKTNPKGEVVHTKEKKRLRGKNLELGQPTTKKKGVECLEESFFSGEGGLSRAGGKELTGREGEGSTNKISKDTRSRFIVMGRICTPNQKTGGGGPKKKTGASKKRGPVADLGELNLS